MNYSFERESVNEKTIQILIKKLHLLFFVSFTQRKGLKHTHSLIFIPIPLNFLNFSCFDGVLGKCLFHQELHY